MACYTMNLALTFYWKRGSRCGQHANCTNAALKDPVQKNNYWKLLSPLKVENREVIF